MSTMKLLQYTNKYTINKYTNRLSGFDCAHNVHANGIMHTQKFVHSTDSCVKII